MGFNLAGLGSFAGGLAGGLDQGLLIQQRRQQMEQQKQAQQLLLANSLSSVFDPNLPANIGSLKLKAIMTAGGIDPASETGKMFIDGYKSMDEASRAAFSSQMQAAGLTPEQMLSGLKMYAGSGQEGALKWLDVVGETAKANVAKETQAEVAKILQGDGPGGELPDPVVERYQTAIEFLNGKGMYEEADKLMNDLESYKGGDAGFTLGQGQRRFDAAGNVIAEVAPAPPASTSIYVGTQYDPTTGQPIPGTEGAAGAGGVGLQKPTQNTVEGDLLNLSAQAQQVSMLESSIRPEWQQVGTRLKMVFASGVNKLGGKLDPETEAALGEFATYRANAANLLTSQLKAMSGAAVTPQEATRLLQVIPAPGTGIFDGDSPQVFATKLRNYKESVNRATARLYYIKRRGLDGSFISQGRETPVGLGLFGNDMDKIIDKRGDEIAAELAKQNPQATTDQISAGVVQQLQVEFGIAP